MAIANKEFKACWDSITQFFASEEGLKDDVSTKMNVIWNVGEDKIKAWMEASVYQGFDVKSFMLLLIRNKKEYESESPNEEIINVSYDSAGASKDNSLIRTMNT